MIGTIRRVISGTNNAVLAIGATAGAVLSIAAIWALLKPGATPTVKLAQAQVESGYTLLEQYESLHQPGALGNASDGKVSSRPALGHRLASDQTTTTTTTTTQGGSPSARPEIHLAVYVSTGAAVADTQPATGRASIGNGEGQGSETTGPTGTTGSTGTTGVTGPSGPSGPTGPTPKEIKEKREAREAAEKKTREKREVAEKRKKEREAAIIKKRNEIKDKKGSTGATSDNTGAHGKGGKYTPPPPSPTPFHQEGNAKVLVGTGASTGAVDAVLAKVKKVLAAQGAPGQTSAGASIQSRCGDSCALRPLIDQAIVDTNSNLAEAAREIAGIFTDTRAASNGHKREPVGVTVDYAIDFSHYVGKTVTVVWTLDSRATGEPLQRSWWRNVIVKQVEPTSDEPFRGNFWAPIPRKRGDYYLTLRLFTGEHEDQSAVTQTFH